MDRDLAIGLLIALSILISLGFALLMETSYRKRPQRRERVDRERVDFYGDHHKEVRARWAAEIRAAGSGWCMERICVMSSRRIEPGAFWHLAHDHERGGPSDYLGSAHPECNEHEARERGVTWPGDRGDTARNAAHGEYDDDQAETAERTRRDAYPNPWSSPSGLSDDPTRWGNRPNDPPF